MSTANLPGGASGPTDSYSQSMQRLCDPQLDPLFWKADRIDARSAWSGHIPFAHWIVSVARPRLLVELGTHTGVSYAAFCSAVERLALNTRCYAVDTWLGDPQAGQYGDQIFAELDQYHRTKFAAFSTLMRCTFDDARAHFIDGTIDLLHIDGLHTYEAVKHDFEYWKGKLSDRAIVLFHDTNERHDDFGVWKLWAELQAQYSSFEFLHAHGLGVLAVGANASDAITRLCKASTDDLTAIRNRFSTLGDRWEAEQREKAGIVHTGVQAQSHAQALLDERTAAQAEIESVKASARAELEQAKVTERHLVARIVDVEVKERTAITRATKLESAALIAQEDHIQELAATQERYAAEIARMQELSAGTEQAQRRAIEASAFWRATRPARHFLTSHPGLHRHAARAAKAVLWTMKGDLRKRLAERKQRLHDANIILRSPYFDEAWYVSQHPDAATSPLPPALHYAAIGRDRRNPGPGFDAAWYVSRHPEAAAMGVHPLVYYETRGRAENHETRPVTSVAGMAPAFAPTARNHETHKSADTVDVNDLLAEHFAHLSPLRTYPVTGEPLRVTLVTDSIGAGSLFGGVGTSIVFAASLARHIGAQLRLVTRHEPADPSVFGDILRLNNIPWDDNIEFVFSTFNEGHEVTVGNEEIFVTTSWWSTHSVRQIANPGRIVYLMQEDERMFYAYGDERLRCIETISDPEIRIVINSRILFDHLTTGPDALSNLSRNGTWFEPAFPPLFNAPVLPKHADGIRRFFFYARPNNLRNLYWRGLEVIQACLEDGTLDPQEWEFHFVGKDMQRISLPHGIRPHFHQNLAWQDYIQLVRTMDVGLCLMDTPHPSYPPLDLAATGAVVVTNRNGLKTSLTHYSPNILCANQDIESLGREVANAVALSNDPVKRAANFAGNRIGDNWTESLRQCLHRLYPNATPGEDHV